MGLITWIIIAVVVLAVIGLGLATFFSGVIRGAEKVGENPVVENATNTASEFVSNATKDFRNQILPKCQPVVAFLDKSPC
jgi:flagellar basal body-associated protein FliL